LAIRSLQGQVEAQNERLEQEIMRYKRAEEAFEQARDGMEERVKIRTACCIGGEPLAAGSGQVQEPTKVSNP